MSIEAERAAQAHRGYDDALRCAVKMAAEGHEASVYWNGVELFVRSSYAPKPPNVEVICIAQQWDERTVQLRFAGARSEWVRV